MKLVDVKITGVVFALGGYILSVTVSEDLLVLFAKYDTNKNDV
jgi:hypothetical protein